ncbi:histone H1/H5 family protein [Nakamurella lactea]|uniref:DNA-binding protein n=1 Tax=Nakamurella lactea TaxID=459515 RepID=UPI0004208263|nr:DNA-binding protein [Nakamurella lactea]
MTAPKLFLTLPEAVAATGMSREQIKKYIHTTNPNDHLPAKKLDNGRYLIKVTVFNEWFERQADA